MNDDHPFELFVPKTEWEVSAVLVKTRVFPQSVIYKFQARHDAMAVSPAQTMREFFDRFLAHVGAGVASLFFRRYLGEGINWHHTDHLEWLYLLGIAVVSVLAGFVPAAKAYRTPVATNLVAG